MTFVLLRGLMRDRRHWYGFARRLEATGAQVITPDLPGNGTLAEINSPLSIPDYADYVWAQIDEVLSEGSTKEVLESVYLIGLSMGGMLALEMAKHKPNRVKKVVLINSSAANLSPWYCRFQLSSLVKSAWEIGRRRLNGELSGISLLEATVIQLTSECRGDDIKLIQDWSHYRQQGHTSIINGFRQLVACASFDAPDIDHANANDLINSPVNAFVKSSVNVIVANRDRLAHPSCGQALADFYDTQAIYLDDCGHDVSLDKPEPLLRLLLGMAR
ncbi:putative hydrolase or acyltransferase of alpha/beta superfamily [Shewanella psychrophila]|uniref:Putative hydrolase or acyltransferase of alpha/beta superfamily n=1 Tax=Shewanella psychrophila TaxID=225848 RepID=A0A1S6HW40_9GAMM|nr:alpha/beta hydrolase [Shewanella psychrophila]AQS39628.1 putative hydrolase or acyltransferase of alpha/beta superfamily [Shewanella psychrophila]